MKMEFTFGKARPPTPPEPETPFHILVLGDFDGRTSRDVTQPLADRRPLAVDVDTFEALLKRLRAEVQLSLVGAGSSPLRIELSSLDDLHPDHLFERMDLFAALRQMRKRLLDPATFPSAAKEVRAWAEPGPVNESSNSTESKPPRPGTTTSESNAQTIERLLGRTPAAETAAHSAASDLIRKLVAPYIVSAPASDEQALVAAVDSAVAESMRRVLHDPAFQALEATWRGIDFLLRRLETGETLKIFVLNASKAELFADVNASDDLATSEMFRVLVQSTVQTPGAQPWSLVLGLYGFENETQDLALLRRVATLAQAAGAPFVAAAGTNLFQTALQSPRTEQTVSDELSALRDLPEAAYLGLVCPRFLLRLPYGEKTEPVSSFSFEEFPDKADASRFLWANPVLALGALIGESFVESGWEMSPGAGLEIGGLPVHWFKQNGQSQMTPCAEVWLTDAQAERLLEQGLMPFQSIQGKDAIRLARAQSVRWPLSPLAGRWQQQAHD